MKSHQDPRHIRRIKNMQAIFAWSCGNSEPSTTDSPKIIRHIKKIDQTIQIDAPKWPLEKINKVDLSVLRCAIWELLFRKSTPPKVVIDEAIELAKEFGTESSSAFVNGVLGTVITTLKKNEATA